MKKILGGEFKYINIIWLQAQACSGDTIALFNATEPSILDLVLGRINKIPKIRIVFHPTIMVRWGVEHISNSINPDIEKWNVMSIMEKALKDDLSPYILIVEGSIPDEEENRRKEGFYCSIGEYKGKIIYADEYLKKLAEKAYAIVAVGTCASFGGIPSGTPNPTNTYGVRDILGHDWESVAGLPVINIPGCPAAGDWQLKTLLHLLLYLSDLAPQPELDEYNRPRELYSETVHQTCPNGIYFASNNLADEFGERYCIYSLGCKGPIAECPINKYPFIEDVGMCTSYGSLCIGCTMPEFPDEPYEGFLIKLPPTLIPPLELIPTKLRKVKNNGSKRDRI